MSDNPPVAKYRLTLTITGNSHDEIERELLSMSRGGYLLDSDYLKRDEFHVIGGAPHVDLGAHKPRHDAGAVCRRTRRLVAGAESQPTHHPPPDRTSRRRARMSTFGWCEAAPGAVPYHALCHRSYTNQAGMERVCGCPCHDEPIEETP